MQFFVAKYRCLDFSRYASQQTRMQFVLHAWTSLLTADDIFSPAELKSRFGWPSSVPPWVEDFNQLITSEPIDSCLFSRECVPAYEVLGFKSAHWTISAYQQSSLFFWICSPFRFPLLFSSKMTTGSKPQNTPISFISNFRDQFMQWYQIV